MRGPERSPIGGGGGGHAGGVPAGGTPNVSRLGQRRRLSFDAWGIWSKLLIAAYECPIAYPHWCGPVRDTAPTESPHTLPPRRHLIGARYGAQSIRCADRKKGRAVPSATP